VVAVDRFAVETERLLSAARAVMVIQPLPEMAALQREHWLVLQVELPMLLLVQVVAEVPDLPLMGLLVLAAMVVQEQSPLDISPPASQLIQRQQMRFLMLE
jgi:hypothetical protein